MQDFTIQIQQLFSNLPDFAGVVIVAFFVINAIMWFFLPFAIYGIQAKMNKSRKIQEKILKTLEAMG